MQENQNINFIEEIRDNDNSIIEIQDDTKQVPIVNDNVTVTNVTNNVPDDYIKELPTWDINPPLEVNRGA